MGRLGGQRQQSRQPGPLITGLEGETGGSQTQFHVLFSFPLLNYLLLLSQTFSLAQGNGNSAPSQAADKLKQERMTERVCEDGKGPAPHTLSTGVNAFCRCHCPNPLDPKHLQLTRSPVAARAQGLGPAEAVLSLTSQIPRADRTLKPGGLTRPSQERLRRAPAAARSDAPRSARVP